MTEEQLEFHFYDGEEVDLESAVYQALGAASVCWESLEYSGVFDSNRAAAVGRALINKVKELARDGKIVQG
jgi:hypothetical protein